MQSRDKLCWRQVRNAEQTEQGEGTQSNLPPTSAAPSILPGVSLLGLWLEPLGRVPRAEISHLSTSSPVPGRSSMLGHWDWCPAGPWWLLCRCSGGCGGKGSTSQTHSEDPPLRARPCLVGSWGGSAPLLRKTQEAAAAARSLWL